MVTSAQERQAATDTANGEKPGHKLRNSIAALALVAAGAVGAVAGYRAIEGDGDEQGQQVTSVLLANGFTAKEFDVNGDGTRIEMFAPNHDCSRTFVLDRDANNRHVSALTTLKTNAEYDADGKTVVKPEVAPKPYDLLDQAGHMALRNEVAIACDQVPTN